MSAASDDEYELLPGTFDVHVGESRSRRRTLTRRGCFARLLRPLRKNPNTVFCLSLVLFICSVVFTTRDFVKAKTTTANDYYHSVLNKLWPVGLPDRTDNWENENSKALHALVDCMASDSCGQNQTSIVLLSSIHFSSSIAGAVSGEDIWASSILDALQQLGYTTIFTTNNQQLAATYRQFPDLVKVIILEGASSRECFKDKHCIKTKDHPLGIPAWKMLSFHFWTRSANPLGNAWTLSPENFALISPKDSAENVYLGYSIEKACRQIPTIPFEERPRQAYILAKRMDYFGEPYSWPEVALDKPPFDVSFIAGVRHASTSKVALPKGITDLGTLNKTQFYRHLSESRVLVGIGSPALSPSPYDALCMGVPFINPIRRWDDKNFDDRSKWLTQHEVLKYQDPPYVYNIKNHDEKAFWDALQKALDTPIDRFIVPDMTMEALKARVGRIVEDDWKGKAERLLEDRKAKGKGDLFEI